MDIREAIVAHDDIEREVITIDEWGVTIEVRTMTAADAAWFAEQLSTLGRNASWAKLWPEIIIATCFDAETGAKLFTVEDREMLALKSSKVLRRIAHRGLVLAGLNDEGADRSKKG